MKHILLILSLAVLAALVYSCDDMYENQEKYEGEIVYPAKFDTIIGHLGFERVELDLMKAGRISSGKIKLGKAKKTVISYDNQVLTIDSVVSYVNITGLTEPKLYRFSVYTMDEYGNTSIPEEIALLPFTGSDLEQLQVTTPNITKSPSAAIIDWPKGLSSVVMDYQSLSYEYTDKDGVTRKGERGTDPRFYIGNLEAEQSVIVKMKYQVVPIVNKDTLLDVVTLVDSLTITTPNSSTEFLPAEKEVFQANGITTFTSEGVSGIEKLVYPVYARSLSDVFYFPNLREIDLTGGSLFPVTTLDYSRNDVDDSVGGGDFVPFLRNVADISLGDMQALRDMLESGIIRKVYYIPHSMGLDELLAPYVDSGVAQLTGLPSSVLMPDQFRLNGNVQDKAWNMDITFPATDVPAGTGLQNTYKITLKAKSASMVFALPKEYALNVEEYRYLKFKVYAPAKSSFSGIYAPYQRVWLRFMNRMWSFSGNSIYGQQYWAPDPISIADADLQKWTDITVDLSSAVGKHNRVIVLNIGKEPGVDFKPPSDIIYYFSDIRLSKE